VSDVLRLRQEQIEWRRVDHAIVVLDRQNADEFRVNSSGSELWEALCAGCSAAELAATLAARFELDLESAERDVAAFLAILEERQLLDRSPT
jgi:hypothetical protein